MADITDGFPAPTGNGFSVSPVAAGINTSTQFLAEGYAVATFQPLDPNNPGTVTLYNSAGTVILTMLAGGYAEFAVPVGGASYYFNASNGAQLLSAVTPSMTSRFV